MLARNNPFIDRIERVEPFQWAPPILRYNRWEFRQVPNLETPRCVIETDEVHDLNVICAITESMQQPNVVDHRTDIWCRAAHVNPSDKRPILNLTKEELAEGKAWADQHLGDGVRVGVVLKAHDPARTWPYSQAFALILRNCGYKVCTIDMMGSVGDIPAVIGKTIRQTAAILAHLHAVVTPDSGILHVAGTLGTPIVGIFGSTDGTLRCREYAGTYSVGRQFIECASCWYTRPCLKSRNPAEHIQCLKRISTEIVLYYLEACLERFGVTLPYRT